MVNNVCNRNGNNFCLIKLDSNLNVVLAVSLIPWNVFNALSFAAQCKQSAYANSVSLDFNQVSIDEVTNSSSMPEQSGQTLTNNAKVIVKQETSIPEPAPVRHPGQPPHQVVFAPPLRDDGKVWSGRDK